ncbi:MAG: hypothetical protein O2921_00450 [Chloroflexi bacterium]|nr:hypothetical protein [Chloroflexota bacterium]MDA1281088.1 hypothetical protein [Chloroflexota bacterium]
MSTTITPTMILNCRDLGASTITPAKLSDTGFAGVTCEFIDPLSD